jgi:hypothetical protein
MVDGVSVMIFLFFGIVVKEDVVFFIVEAVVVVAIAVDIVRVGLVVTSIGHGRGCVLAILIGRAVVAASIGVVPPTEQWRWTFISRSVLAQILIIAHVSTW